MTLLRVQDNSCISILRFFFFKQKTAYEMRISDWSSDVCSSDLSLRERSPSPSLRDREDRQRPLTIPKRTLRTILSASTLRSADFGNPPGPVADHIARPGAALRRLVLAIVDPAFLERQATARSEERSGGQETVSKCRTCWLTFKKNNNTT